MSRLSNVQTNAASSSCPNAGSSSEHLLGLGDAAGLPRTGNVSIKKRSHSLSSPLSASCSENYAIQCDLSGQTLRIYVHSITLARGVPTGVGNINCGAVRLTPRASPNELSDQQIRDADHK